MSDAERKRSRSVARRILSMVITHNNNTIQNCQRVLPTAFTLLDYYPFRSDIFNVQKETCRLATNILSF